MTGTSWSGPSEVARTCGVSTDTLRHYERLGLLTGIARTAAGYRRYQPAAIERVHLIQRALVVGFTLNELGSVLAQRDRGVAPCRRVRALVGERLEMLEQQLREMSAIRDEMRLLVDEWDERLANTPPGQRARLLDLLAGHPAFNAAGKAMPPRRRPTPSSNRRAR